MTPSATSPIFCFALSPSPTRARSGASRSVISATAPNVYRAGDDLMTKAGGVEALSRFEAWPSCATESWFADASEVGLGLAREAPSRLVVEVTEHAAVDDYRALKAALGRLRAAGVRLAIDDVGAGFSSMAHILRFQPDLLKLDGALVAGAARSSKPPLEIRLSSSPARRNPT